MLLTVNWAHVWLVTVLGFGIVLVLLIFLIFIMMGFGAIMQLINKPKAAKPAEAAPAKATVKLEKTPASADDAAAIAMALKMSEDNADMAAVAMALSLANGSDKAAVAMALYLSGHAKKGFPTPLMPQQSRLTAWNAKAYNMNNVGF